MLCNAKVKRVKFLVRKMGKNQKLKESRIATIRKPIYDTHYVKFVENLEKED